MNERSVRLEWAMTTTAVLLIGAAIVVYIVWSSKDPEG